MKKIIVYITLAILVAACAPSSRHSGEVTGVGGTAWNEPTPYGMVLISRGSYKMGPAEKDSIWGTQQEPRAVSIDAFWMDETENTNNLYSGYATLSFGNASPIPPMEATKCSKSKKTGRETPSSLG